MNTAAILDILVRANTSQATAALTKFNRELKTSAATANTASNSIGSKLGKAAKYTGVAVAGGLTYGLYKSIQAGVSFEKQMDSVGAVANATGKDLNRLREQALKLGQDTAYSASEAAEAQAELVKGGIKVRDVLGGALPAALNLAAAGEVELGEAAETTANAMQLFSLRGKDAGHIADLLATAANKTTADVSGFAMALKQGGGVAKLAGYDIDQTVTALEALAAAGYKNSDAGTSLKTAFIQLLKPTEKQAALTEQLGLNFITQNGEMKDAAAISKQLQVATEGMTKAERAKNFATLAGTDGVRTLQALYDAGPATLEKYAAANEKVGTAQDIAQQKMDNTAGSIEQLKGAFETLGIRVFDAVGPTFRDMVDEASEVVTEFTDVISDKKMTRDQKFDEIANIIDRELGKIIPKLGEMIDKALPVVLEMGGKIAVALGKGVVKAWWNSDFLTRLFVVGAIVAKLGGWAKIEAVGKLIGTRLGKGMGKGVGIGLVAGLVLLAPELKRWAEDNKYAIRQAGVDVGEYFVNALIETINEGLHQITSADGPIGGALDQAFGAVGVHLPDLSAVVPDIPKFEWDPSWQHAPRLLGEISAGLGDVKGKLGGTDKATDEAGDAARRYLRTFGKAVNSADGEVNNHKRVVQVALNAVGGYLKGGGDDLSGYYRDLARSLGKGEGRTRDFKENAGGNFLGLSDVAGGAFMAIMQNLNNSLGSLGAKKVDYKAISADPNGASLGRQTGGLVPGFRTGSLVPGIGSGDKVPLHLGGRLAAMVEPGELVSVANRNATAALMAHNKAVPRFADGGVIQQALGPYTIPPIQYDANHAGGNSHLHLDFFTVGQALAYGHKMQGMGWNIGEYTPKGGNPWGFGGISTQHQSPGHYDGTAFDANTAADETRAEVEAVVRMLGGSAKGLGAAVEQLKKVTLGGPDGPLKSLGQAALDKTWKAANAYLTKHTPTDGGGAISYVSGGSGDVVTQMGRVMIAKGMNAIAAAGAIGNSYGESHWNPTAMEPGTDNGGLFGFTSGEKSLASLRAYADKVGQPWSDVGTQVSFMFTTLGSILGMMNSAGSTDESTRIFMDEWERPAAWAAAQSIGTRQAAAAKVYPQMQQLAKAGGKGAAKLAKGGFLDPFIDKVYGAKDGKKQTAADIRKAATKALGKKIDKLKTHGLFFDGSGEISGKLASLSDQAAMFGDYADYASSTGDDGKGLFRGKTEAEWLQQQLDSLWAFRQMLAKVEVKVKERQKEAADIAKRANKLLRRWSRKLADAKEQLAKEGETPEKWKGLDPVKDSPEKWNKLSEKKRLDLAAKFYKAGGKLPGDRLFSDDGRLLTYEDNPNAFPNVKGMSAVASMLKGTAIPRLTGSGGVIPSLAQDIKTLAENFDTVQGSGYTHRLLKHGLPELGAMNALGGDIFNVQSRLAELGKPTSSDSDVLDIAGISDIIEAARFGTFDYQMDPTFAGMFAKGGSIPAGMWGIAGEAGPEPVVGPATVLPNSSLGGNVHVENNVYFDGLDLVIDTKIDGRLAKKERREWLAEKAGR